MEQLLDNTTVVMEGMEYAMSYPDYWRQKLWKPSRRYWFTKWPISWFQHVLASNESKQMNWMDEGFYHLYLHLRYGPNHGTKKGITPLKVPIKDTTIWWLPVKETTPKTNPLQIDMS